MRRPHVPDELRDRPFTRAAGIAAGLPAGALGRGPWRQVLRGVWVHEEVPDSRELRVAAAALVVPAYGVLCGLTAAEAHGADVRRAGDLDVHVAFPEGRRIRGRTGLVVSQETLATDDITLLDGLAVTSAVRTAFDCLRLLRGADRVVVADALTHLERTSVEELRAYFARHRRLRNLRIGERLLDDVEPLAESPPESRLRLELVVAGLPRPVAQYVVHGLYGEFVARLDLAYPELRIAIEYDGAWHWDRRREDDRRRDRLRALGWEVLVVSADDLWRSPDAVVAAVAAARRRRAG